MLGNVSYAASMLSDDSPFSRYLLPALAVARRLLGAPEDTKVLLAVDEMAKFAVDAPHVPNMVNKLISRLCRYSDRDPRLYLTLSAYGARDIATFATGSNRPILLQPLPPIFPVAPMLPGHTEVLPPVLRVFADEKLRMQLPAWGRPLYARLSRILLSTGGHPRSMRDVLTELRSAFPAGKVFEQINGTDRLIDPAAFVRLLETELTQNDLESKCSNAISGVAPFSAIHCDDQLEELARDTAQMFIFPQSTADALLHQAMLSNSIEGRCQFLSQSRESMQGHAFVPLPVLEMSYWAAFKTSTPCTAAMALVVEALSAYKFDKGEKDGGAAPGCGAGSPSNAVAPADQRGKSFEKLALASFLLYVRANSEMDISLFEMTCSLSGAGSEGAIIKGGNVALWDDVSEFPRLVASKARGSEVDSGLSALVARLTKEPSWNGAMFMPQSSSNPCADVLGLFRTPATVGGKEAFVLMALQCKDWLMAPEERKQQQQQQQQRTRTFVDVVQEWRHSQNHMVGVGASVLASNGHGAPLRFELPDAVVDVHYVLFTSNPLPSLRAALQPSDALVLEPNESVLDLHKLSEWLPTAGLNAMAVHRMRQMFLFSE